MCPAALDWLFLVHAPLLATTVDGASIRAANAEAERLMGEHLAGQPLRAVVGSFAADRLQPLLRGAGHEAELVLLCVTPRGLGTFGFRAAHLPGEPGGKPGAAGTILTITDHGAPDPVAGRSIDWARMLEEVVDGLPVGVEIYDACFRELFANMLSDEMFGYDSGGKVLHHDDWWEHGFPDPVQRAAVVAEWREKVASARIHRNRVHTMEHEVTCRDGARRIVQFRFRFIGDTYTVVFWDVTQRRRLEQDLRRLAGTDELTGLVNRRGFMERARMALSPETAGQLPLSLLMIDADHFKRINDVYGHNIGDRVLKEMARRCRRILRADDVLARLGGEEFAALLPSTPQEEARRMADALLDVIRTEPMDFGTVRFTLEASIGGACALSPETTLENLMEHADRALYAAKGRGRNCVVFDPAVD